MSGSAELNGSSTTSHDYILFNEPNDARRSCTGSRLPKLRARPRSNDVLTLPTRRRPSGTHTARTRPGAVSTEAHANKPADVRWRSAGARRRQGPQERSKASASSGQVTNARVQGEARAIGRRGQS